MSMFSAYEILSHKRGEGVWKKTLKSHNFLKLYFYVYYMLMVSEILTICAGFTSMIVNVFLSSKRGREGVKKLRDKIS